jgi:hypothetical protein
MTPTAEDLIRRQAARSRGEPLISVAGERAAPYSLARAAMAGAGFEAEVSAELLRDLEGLGGFQHHGGVMVPPQIFTALEATAETGGRELVFTVPGPFGRALRPAPVAARLGARIIPGGDNLRLVRVADGYQVSWIATRETPALPVDPVDLELASEEPVPSFGMVSTSWSRRLAAQSNPAIGALFDDDARAAVFAVIDAALIGGTGEDGQPLGLLAREFGGIDLSNAAPSWANLVEAEALVSDLNADGGPWACPTSGRGRGALRLCPVLGNVAAGPAWIRNQVLDHPAFASNHVEDPAIILGAWRNAVVGLHAVEIVVDPYTAARQGLINATVYALVSIGVLHPAFVVLSNGDFPEAS